MGEERAFLVSSSFQLPSVQNNLYAKEASFVWHILLPSTCTAQFQQEPSLLSLERIPHYCYRIKFLISHFLYLTTLAYVQ